METAHTSIYNYEKIVTSAMRARKKLQETRPDCRILEKIMNGWEREEHVAEGEFGKFHLISKLMAYNLENPLR